MSEALIHARVALDGLSLGDALGSTGGYEFSFTDSRFLKENIKHRRLPVANWRFTDDTQMALSIYEILCKHGEIEQDALARSFAAHFERGRGYGMGAIGLLSRMKIGEDWHELAPAMFGGTGSFGNGSAMRIAPLGAYFADDIPALKINAERSAQITHTHPEGIAGAIAVAMAAAVACNLRGQAKPSIAAFIAEVLPHVPASEVKDGLELAQNIASDTNLQTVVAQLGNGSGVSCQDTVPFVIWSSARWLNNFEEAIWYTLSAGGDADTTSAMVGGIVASYVGQAGLPAEWLTRREPLPAWAFDSC